MRRMYVPNKGGLRDLIMEEMHNVLYFGYLGVNKIVADMKPLYFWLGLKKDGIAYVRQCFEYRRVKAKNMHPTGLLFSHHVPNYKW